MTTSTKSRLTEEQKQQVRFWIHTIGCDLVACYSQIKNKFKEKWSNNTFKIYEALLKQGFYDDGVAIICGRIRRGEYEGKYISVLDFDTLEAFEKFSANDFDYKKLASITRVEWHGSLARIHVFFITDRPFKNANGAGLEVKANKLLTFVSPSIHKDGKPYTALGTEAIGYLDNVGQMRIENCIAAVIPNYQSEDQINDYIKYLELDSTILDEGERHNGILVMANSYFFRYSGEWANLTDEQRFDKLIEYDKKHCRPSLYETSVTEFKQIWRDIERKFTGERQERRDKREEVNAETGYSYGPDVDAELKGNVFYRISEKPTKLIIAYDKTKHLIEASVCESKIDNDDIYHKTLFLRQNRTYLTCIPTKIVRHKNPLTYLEAAANYTITFADAADEHNTFVHKTLSEILCGLKDLGYVYAEGADGALGVMVQAFKQRKLIEDNEDMDYTGFFIADDKIIPSNLEIKEPTNADLEDSLKFIEELAPYYEGRLDLLSTLIQWATVAPVIFMLKGNNYFLKWLHFYGFPNATKSNSGKIALGVDRHQDDPDFLLSISRIDTIARLGDILSHTTFPKLVDEADLNGREREWLVNAIKSAIEGKTARSKFKTNRSSTSTPIPALSPLILTSNPPPPSHDSGYMRKVIDRNFARCESHKEDDPTAIKFKELLRTDLIRLGHLGDFRNWFVMNNQAIILDETRPLPLDLGLKIVTEAYTKTGRKMPELFKQRLPEKQLEESLGNASVIVKRAFETYIDTEFNRHLQFFKQQDPGLTLPNSISDRFVKLIDSSLLSDAKRLEKSKDIILRNSILVELYKYGVTRDQLPNLRALNDYLGLPSENYRKVHGGYKVVSCTGAQLTGYFDKVEDYE
jgi:hypothetical protein